MACNYTKKVQFKTERDALDELVKITLAAIKGTRPGRGHWSGDKRTLETGVFECQHCNQWHLTARPWESKISSPRESTKP